MRKKKTNPDYLMFRIYTGQPELANDLTKVVWLHATNLQEKLFKKAL